MAGADLTSVAVDDRDRAIVQMAIDEAFVSGFRLAVFGAAILAVAAAAFGWGIRSASVTQTAKRGQT
jgi:ABC-type enterobactin transport system permease subunit